MDHRHAQEFLLILLLAHHVVSAADSFIFHGFQRANLTLDGTANISSNGLLCLSNDSNNLTTGHAFYPSFIRLKNQSSFSAAAAGANGTVLSFSTVFAFAIRTSAPGSRGQGFAFALFPSLTIVGQSDANYLGLYNTSNMGNSSNHIFAVEFGNDLAAPFNDTDNQVGIGIKSPIFNASTPASYTSNTSSQAINLLSGSTILAWIDYQSDLQQFNVSISPITDPVKPMKSLLSTKLDLSSVIEDLMYVGFSCATANVSSEYYILGWSFSTNGEAQHLDLSLLPLLPTMVDTHSGTKWSIIMACSFGAAAVLMSVLATAFYIIFKRRKDNDSDKMEGWELEHPRRFGYKVLSKATHRFRKEKLLGSGGFGSVYRGILPGTSTEVAVKRVSHNAKQGLREFIAEISSLGRLRHRNLVQLQGWCRRQEELLLVYDFMPNGSLDSFLFDDRKAKNLGWEERFKILKGIASGLLYLHEGWEQVVVHRDVKASNVLLDAEMNGRLGDFGLARFYEHGKHPETTRVVGTLGYIAPEMSRTGKATASADVFSYGALLLEVASGKRPYEMLVSEEEGEMLLVEWVLKNWQSGHVLRTMDSRLEGRFVREEAELVLKLGVLCSQAMPERRPTMRQVVQYLDGDTSIPKVLSLNAMALRDDLGFDQLVLPYPESEAPSCDSTNSQSWIPTYEI